MSDVLTTGNNPAPSISPNPFTAILQSAGFHNTFTNLIDAVLSDDALTTNCRLVFAGTQIVPCTNCTGNIHKPDGPIPFPRGTVCPLCQGKKIEVEETDDVMLCVINDSKKWMIWSRPVNQTWTTNTPKALAETICRVELYPKIKACDYLIIDTDHQDYTHNKFHRFGEPELMGLGRMEYIVTAWQRIE